MVQWYDYFNTKSLLKKQWVFLFWKNANLVVKLDLIVLINVFWGKKVLLWNYVVNIHKRIC